MAPPPAAPPSVFKRIGVSVFPNVFGEKPPREPGQALFNSLLLHFRPRRVDERTLRLSLTWGLGGSAAVLMGLLFGSGILLKFTYQPVPEKAYESILRIMNDVPFGRLIRNVHHWSANGLVLVAALHMLRVFFTGAFRSPRQFNWVVGLGLFTAVLASNFTGYLLPWDQLAYWAVTICAGMLDTIPLIGHRLQALLVGGSELGPRTLAIFFALHTGVMPALLLLLLPFHFWRIRKAGGLVVPRTPDEDQAVRGARVPAIPNLIVRELAVATLVAAVILILSALLDAPIGDKANPGLSPNPTKAPWYFAGVQELLFHFHPLVAVIVFPAALAAGLLALPYLNLGKDSAGVWFASRAGRKTATVAALAALVLTPAAVIVDGFVFDSSGWLRTLPAALRGGLLPTGMLIGTLALIYRMPRRIADATRMESVQAVFVFLATSWALLTLTCVAFRGSGMSLAWPWS
ncbi:MAG: cytochrome b N-terminal domain-containing protein [Desulfobacterales bacterium]|jgi:quinol-cytochrome oxidoreductase complex cytochrome b subunit